LAQSEPILAHPGAFLAVIRCPHATVNSLEGPLPWFRPSSRDDDRRSARRRHGRGPRPPRARLPQPTHAADLGPAAGPGQPAAEVLGRRCSVAERGL